MTRVGSQRQAKKKIPILLFNNTMGMSHLKSTNLTFAYYRRITRGCLLYLFIYLSIGYMILALIVYV